MSGLETARGAPVPSSLAASRKVRWAALILLAAAAASAPQTARNRQPMRGFPSFMLWSWEHPDDLRFLNPHLTGVAFLTGSIRLRDGRFGCQLRHQPLKVPRGAALMPVVRIDSEGDLSRKPPPEAVAGKIAEWAAMPGARAVQIDFDARASERDWYRALLREVRARLPKQQSLSMTALASWCEPDGWMADLPVDEAIPMLFRMGRGEAWTGGEPAAPLCRGSAGVSTDELPPHLPPARRIYFFHPGSWTKSDYDAAWLVSRARITGRRPWE